MTQSVLLVTADSNANEKILKELVYEGLIEYSFANLEKGLDKKNKKRPNEPAFFTLNISTLDGDDILASDEIYDISAKLQLVLGKINWKDRRQLESHYYSNNEVFVTDDNDMLCCRGKLSKLGFNIMTTNELVQYVRRRK